MFYILAAILIIIFGAVMLKLNKVSQEKKRLARERLLRGEALKTEAGVQLDDGKQFRERVLIAIHKRLEGKHIIFDGDTPIAELKFETCVIEDSIYKFSWHGRPYRGYEAEKNGKNVAFADQSVFKEFRGVVIQHGGIRYRLKKAYNPWLRRVKSPFILERGDREIGSLTTETKLFRAKRKTIDLPEKMPLYLKLFIFWIALRIWGGSDEWI
jgi:hypothetical protein